MLADRGGTIVGFLATRPNKKAVIAGPLVIAPGTLRPILTVMRLIEAYELMLRKAGVQSFYFMVAGTNPVWRRIVERMGHQPYSGDDTGMWFRKAVS